MICVPFCGAETADALWSRVPLRPVRAGPAPALPPDRSGDWGWEPKFDGLRCIGYPLTPIARLWLAAVLQPCPGDTWPARLPSSRFGGLEIIRLRRADRHQLRPKMLVVHFCFVPIFLSAG